MKLNMSEWTGWIKKQEKAKVACAPPLRVTSDGRADRKQRV